MTTTDTSASIFDPAYPVAKLKSHPRNPRRSAVADADMVTSIKEHGVLEPIVAGPDGTVIMGHRRTDGLKKAKRKTGPVIIRNDLDTPEKQLEVMLVENLHRESLTEMEEAESFGLLKELGYTQKDIAAKVGRSQRLVGERLKLLRLSKKSQDALHKGQLTFGDAIALAEFDDDPKLQDRLAGKSGYQLAQAIERERRDRKAMETINKQVAEYTAAGVPEVTVPKGTRSYHLTTPEATRLENTSPGRRPQSHKKCMAYVILAGDDHNAPELVLVCTNPKGHKKPGPTKAELAEKARREEEAAQRKADELARTEAAGGRLDAILQLALPGLKFDDRLADALRVTLPPALWEMTAAPTGQLFDALAVPEERRWRVVETYSRNLEDVAAYGRFVKWLAGCGHHDLGRVVLALLAVRTEYALEPELRHEWLYARSDERGTRARLNGLRYLRFLDGIGHDFTDADTALLTAAKWTPAPPPETASTNEDASADETAGPDAEPVDPYELVHLYDGSGLAKCRLPATSGKTLSTTKELDNVTCSDCVDDVELEGEPTEASS